MDSRDDCARTDERVPEGDIVKPSPPEITQRSQRTFARPPGARAICAARTYSESCVRCVARLLHSCWFHICTRDTTAAAKHAAESTSSTVSSLRRQGPALVAPAASRAGFMSVQATMTVGVASQDVRLCVSCATREHTEAEAAAMLPSFTLVISAETEGCCCSVTAELNA